MVQKTSNTQSVISYENPRSRISARKLPRALKSIHLTHGTRDFAMISDRGISVVSCFLLFKAPNSFALNMIEVANNDNCVHATNITKVNFVV